ncbi:MAG: flagellar basal-body MS-ring/collar protein FliF [Pseudomonadota bacterium]|nr:flagellar basal-body MS-ring/collar protein FliF [Pseudomonadota bacterium]
MNPLVDAIKNLGGARLAMMGAVSSGLVMFFIFITTRLWTPSLSLLYGDLDPAEATQIVNELQSLNITGELASGGTQVLVPATEVGNARMAMAERGLPAGGNIGYELFDKDQGLGTSNFVQNVNNLRAMEGELGRSISSIATVKSARVHLVLPRRELFSRQQQEPSASVILKMRGAARLDRKKVAAVQHLVAAAVPNLKITRISIVDDRGTLLARGGEEDESAGISGLTADELRLSVENRLARKIEQMLEAMVGIGNVRAEVYADVDPQREVISEERYDPEGQVLRSSQSVTESSQSAEGSPDNVSVATNLPDGAGGGSSTASKSQRTEEANNFEVSKSIINRVKEAGTILGLSVAVAINGIEAIGEDGKQTFTPRTPEQLQQYERIIRSALGIDDSRGDKLEIVSVRFAGASIGIGADDFSSTLLSGFDPDQLQRMVEIIVLAVVSVLIILLVVRPLIAKVFEVTPQAMTPPPGMEGMPPMLPSDTAPQTMTGDMAQLSGPDAMMGAEGAMIPTMSGGQPEESLIDMGQVEGRVRASSLRKVGEIIEKHPDEAVSIIRNWMYQEQ